MKNSSLWLDDIKNYRYKELNEDINVDILIIGGGITGVSTAYHLINSKLKVCLVERNQIGTGVSARTTGKLTYLQDLIYTKITKKYSMDIAKSYLNAQKDAIKLVENIINKNNIECNYRRQKSFLFASDDVEIRKVKHESELLKYMGVKFKEEKLPLSIRSVYSISVDDTAYFHPVKYIRELAKICSQNEMKIYENTKIVNVEKENDIYVCLTGKNKIIAKKVIFACHYPFFIYPYLFPLKGHLERSYISATLVKDNYNISGINTSKSTKSFRYHSDNNKNYFIYLNGSHNLAFKYNTKENFNDLLIELSEMNLMPKYIWSNKDIITNDYLLYIGVLDDNLLIGTGYNTWGMTNGSIAGKILSDIILSKNNKYQELFDPKRDVSSICSVTNDIFSSAKPFVENKLIKNKSFYSGNVIFTKKNGKNVAIYIDEENKEHIVYNKCPHLKCSLIFNEVEKTWDCPCHASRFDIDGNVIEGPSCYNITFNDND